MMLRETSKPAYKLSIAIAVLAALVAAGGLWLNGLYRDNPFVTSAWKGNDVITLFVAVPILVAALVFSRRGSLKAQLMWMGALDYMLYTYAFYLFGAAFNGFFLVYAALLGLSIFALIFGLLPLEVARIGPRDKARVSITVVAGYMLFVAGGLTAIYLAQSVGFVFTGQLPPIVTQTGHPTSIIFALDLTLLVPVMVLGALWLLQRKAWGYALAGISLVKGPLYTLALTVASLWAQQAGVEGAGSEIPLWASLTVLGLAASALFYKNVQEL